MLKRIFAAVLLVLALGALPVQSAEFKLNDPVMGGSSNHWKVTSEQLNIETKIPFSVEKIRLHGGKQAGVDLLKIDNGILQITLIPTRGMGIYNVKRGDLRFGWDSPVKEIVNPAFIDLESRNGLGWLDGFNEMMVRCGYEWTGHPGIDDDGILKSLHGRAQNTPASDVKVVIDEQPPYAIHVIGKISEKTFKFSDLETITELYVVPGENHYKIKDKLTNLADYDNEYQIIYHSNFGTPILEKGAIITAPVKQISPFNNYAKKGLDSWQTYLGPTKGYDEMVFNIKPYTDKKGNTLVILHDKNEKAGVSIAYNVKQLPVLTLWKNTDTKKQGYVTGLEPGTSYAYNTKYQRPLGLVPTIKAGETKTFELTYSMLNSKAEIKNELAKINAIQGSKKTELHKQTLVKLP